MDYEGIEMVVRYSYHWSVVAGFVVCAIAGAGFATMCFFMRDWRDMKRERRIQAFCDRLARKGSDGEERK